METLGHIFCNYGPIPRLLLEEFYPIATDTEWEEALLAYESGLDCKIVERLRSDPYVLFSEKHGHNDIPSVVLLRPDPAKMKGGYCVSRHQVRSIITHIDRKIGFLSVEGHSQQARQMHNFLLGTAFTKSSAGWIFDGRVHACLRRGGIFKTRSLETSRDVLYFAAVVVGKQGSPHHFTRRQAKTTSAREVFACRRVLWGVGEFWACIYMCALLYFFSHAL